MKSKDKDKLLDAVEALIKATSSFTTGQIKVKRTDPDLRIWSLNDGIDSETFHATNLIGMIHLPLLCYVTYNDEAGRCELVIF